MKDKINDGGPAFPSIVDDPNLAPNREPKFLTITGMSLRDYIAASALPSLIASASSFQNKDWPVTVKEIAEKAYQYADEMIAARGDR